MEEQEARVLLTECGNELLDRKLVVRTWGNISCRLDAQHMLVTPSGLDYRTLKPEDIVLMNIETMEWSGTHKPSSEKGVHAAAYRAKETTEFVIHTHQEFATAIGLAGFENLDISREERERLGGIAKAGYGLSGTKKLTHALEKEFAGGADTVFMVHHGAVTAAASKEEAIERAMLLEEICRRNCRADFRKSGRVRAGAPGNITVSRDAGSPGEAAGSAGAAVNDAAGSPGNEAGAPEKTAAAGGSISGKYAEILASMKDIFPFSAAVTAPAVQECAARKEPVYAQIDDMAQMIGRGIPVAAVQDTARIAELLGKAGAVLVPGLGAIVKAENEDDLEAMQSLTEKAALCHLHTEALGKEKECRLGAADVALQHLVYLKKYSKQKK